MYPALDIAQAFWEKATQKGVPLTAMRLHRLLYLSQLHHHVRDRGRLIQYDPKAWEWGPLYDHV